MQVTLFQVFITLGYMEFQIENVRVLFVVHVENTIKWKIYKFISTN